MSTLSPVNLLGSAAAIGSAFIGTDTLFKTNYVRNFTSSQVSIIAPCVLMEKSDDNYVITEHPTEQGVLITDHMYVLPKVVEINIAYSLSRGTSALQSIGSLIGVSKTPASLISYYEKFLKLQSDREPFSITTGKRHYSNMLIESISQVTDMDSENMLKLTLRCKEILIVNTQYTTSSKYQKDAANTAAPTNNGNQTLKAL